MGGDKKRLVAGKLWIKDILNSRYVKEDGLRPNYILTQDDRKVSRVNLMGTIVSIDEDTSYGKFFIDDGSGNIAIRSFEQEGNIKKIKIGDSILVIGRPREYNGEVYILPEIIKKLENIRWLEVRKIELSRSKTPEKVEVKENHEETAQEEYVEDRGIRQKVYDLIKEEDYGQGVPYEQVLTKIIDSTTDDVIRNMIKSGEIFEVSKGRLKVI